MSKSLAELGSQADQRKRNLQLLRGKERVAEETLANLRAEIEAELSALQSLQDRAQQAFEAIRTPSALEPETPASESPAQMWANRVNEGLSNEPNGQVQF